MKQYELQKFGKNIEIYKFYRLLDNLLAVLK